jgi:hypothetical protein
VAPRGNELKGPGRSGEALQTPNYNEEPVTRGQIANVEPSSVTVAHGGRRWPSGGASGEGSGRAALSGARLYGGGVRGTRSGFPGPAKDWPVLVHLRQFCNSLLTWAARRSAASTTMRLDLTLLEAALLAVTPALLPMPRTWRSPPAAALRSCEPIQSKSHDQARRGRQDHPRLREERRGSSPPAGERHATRALSSVVHG